MKTKLLKKIRKRFVIEYYPNFELMFLNDKKKYGYFEVKDSNHARIIILFIISDEYKQYSRKYKQSKPIKVWYGNS